MDNIYGKKLPGTTLPSASGSDYLLAETNDGKLNWIDSTGAKELADKPWVNSTFLTPSTAASTYVPMQFTLGGATHYIGKEVSLTLSSGTTVLTNCSGTVAVSSNSAKVYINNSPDLTVSGVTLANWMNVVRDGQATYSPVVFNSVSDEVPIPNNNQMNTVCEVTQGYDNIEILMYIYGFGNLQQTFRGIPTWGTVFPNPASGFIEYVVAQESGVNRLQCKLYNYTSQNNVVIRGVKLIKGV